MSKFSLREEIIRQIIMLLLNRRFELALKQVNIDVVYYNRKILTLVINGNIEYIPKK